MQNPLFPPPLSEETLHALKARHGIDLIEMIPAQPAPHHDAFRTWIDTHQEGGMAYLARRMQEREDVRHLFPETKTIFVAALVYRQAKDAVTAWHEKKEFKVAQYAWGADYHTIFKEKLEALARDLHVDCPNDVYRVYVDTGPILERDYAALAGLGWIGKNTCLIHPKLGSFLFLGTILSSRACTDTLAKTPLINPPYPPFLKGDHANQLMAEAHSTTYPLSAQPMTDHCGTCRACIDACPTQALTAPYTLDARKCIAYFTIEHKGDFPESITAEAKDTWQNWIFGCDICQDVCPWNRKAPETRHAAFAPHPMWDKLNTRTDLAAFLETTDGARMLKQTPLARTKVSGLLRNIKAISKNGEDR